MADTKITVILAGGDMELRHYHTLWAAVDSYPGHALVVAETPEPVDGIISETTISKKEFLDTTGRLIRHHGSGGMLQLVQFGHGYSGPRMNLGKNFVDGPDIARLFEENLARGDRPHVSLIMGGCFSGGFARSMQPDASAFQPDFFYGSSPPFSIAFNGLKYFYGADLERADQNRDGVLTIRERAVYDMNQSNPLAVMYSKAGSRDLDLAGNEAALPYFPKSVESVPSHEELMKAVESLRFGEQAVVLIAGSRGHSEELSAWFEEEAARGDGLYKFIRVDQNPESSEYFGTGSAPRVLVVGPNIKRSGVEIVQMGHVGEQIPGILASQDPLQIIFDWREKLSDKNYTKLEYLKALGKNPDLHAEIVGKARESLGSEDSSARTDALRLLKTAIVANGADHKEVFEMLKPMVGRATAEGQSDMEEMAELAQCLRYLEIKSAHSALSAVVTTGALRYGQDFLEAAGIRRIMDGAPDFEDSDPESSEDTRIRTLMLLLLHGEEAEQEFLEAALTDQESLKLRKAAAYFLKESKSGWQGSIGKLLDIFNAEEDVLVLAYLLPAIGAYKGEDLFEYPWKLARLDDIARDPTLPDSLRDSARALSARYKNNFDEYRQMLEKKKAMQMEDALRWRPQMGIGMQGMSRVVQGSWDGAALIDLSAMLSKGLWSDANATRLFSAGIRTDAKAGFFFKDGSLVVIPSGYATFAWSWRKAAEEEFSDIELSGGYSGRYEKTDPKTRESGYENGWGASAGFYIKDHRLGAGFDLHHFPDAEDFIFGLSFRANLF